MLKWASTYIYIYIFALAYKNISVASYIDSKIKDRRRRVVTRGMPHEAIDVRFYPSISSPSTSFPVASPRY